MTNTTTYYKIKVDGSECSALGKYDTLEEARAVAQYVANKGQYDRIEIGKVVETYEPIEDKKVNRRLYKVVGEIDGASEADAKYYRKTMEQIGLVVNYCRMGEHNVEYAVIGSFRPIAELCRWLDGCAPVDEADLLGPNFSGSWAMKNVSVVQNDAKQGE